MKFDLNKLVNLIIIKKKKQNEFYKAKNKIYFFEILMDIFSFFSFYFCLNLLILFMRKYKQKMQTI